MGLEFNGITIKSADDLREALLIETDEDFFKERLTYFVKIWGLDSVLNMLYCSLYRSKGHRGTDEPLIKPTTKEDKWKPNTSYRIEFT